MIQTTTDFESSLDLQKIGGISVEKLRFDVSNCF